MLDLAERDSSTNVTDDPCILFESPAVNASVQLSSWLECQVNGKNYTYGVQSH